MRRFKLVLLIAATIISSGYTFRCYWICTDQTGTQQDYVENRDQCRQYAQLKIDMAMQEAGASDDKTRKELLVSLFSECMSRYGWSVPNGKGEGKPGEKTAANEQALAAMAAAEENKAFMARSTECAFARQAAGVSAISAARAQACDAECKDRLKAAPEAPRPAACPAEVNAMSGRNDANAQ